MRRKSVVASSALVASFIVLAASATIGLAAGQQGTAPDSLDGQVTFSGLPVPGATVTASRGDEAHTTVTDGQGVFRFAALAGGVWDVRVEMLGFATANREATVPGKDALIVGLMLLPPDQIAATGRLAGTDAAAEGSANPTPLPGALAPTPATAGSGGTPPQTSAARPGGAVTPGPPAEAAGPDRSADAAEGFVINGSVNNGAASPFAQLPAFGNNRRGPRSLYNGGVGVLLGNSAWDSRPYSFTGQDAPKPVYADLQVVGSFAGPLRIPRVLKNGPNLFLGYQHTDDHNATTQSALVPTVAERSGDFSGTVDAFGRPIRLVDPTTGVPFPDNVIPQGRISPQAASLLQYYPTPNASGTGYNYERPVLLTTHQDALQARFTELLNPRDQLYGNVAVQRTTTDSGNIFGFVDSTRVSGVDAPINWSHRVSQFFSFRLRFQYTDLSTDVTPFFAGRENVSGIAGIMGNNQEPPNWGPPNLAFSSGTAGLASAQFASNGDRTVAWGAESLWSRGRHNVTIGADVKLRHLDLYSQQNARGTFTFNGAATGSDVADFLLGLPRASSIAFGNPDKYLRQSLADGYVTDDLRLSPTFTANIGLRWEYEAPFAERQGRLVNLDIAPGFAAVSPVIATDPVGAVTGQRYPGTLLRPDWRGFQPRLGAAWRPIAGSSLVVRAGYGVYRNTAAYDSIIRLLAQQPPLSTTLSVESSPTTPLTLENGFIAPPGVPANTFAVDPNFRIGVAQNWQVLVQRDLPASLTMTATYLGTKGSRLMQEILPNTYPLGAANPCPACPSGFVYLASNGTSNRQAGQVQLRRRLHAGLTATAQYTLAKATDDAAAAFTGASVNGASIAQDWLHPDDERAPSSFDQRHLLTVQLQYTSGVGMGGGTLIDGARGSLLKGWTITSQLTAGSGLPLTPVYLTSVPGTGVTGTIRGATTGASPTAASPGLYANPLAFAPPAPGQWGDAGRNSLRGPAQFGLNASVGRSFLWTERLTLDWRIDATNVLDRVTFAAVNTFVGSPQFGQATQANAMRKLTTSLRLRF